MRELKETLTEGTIRDLKSEIEKGRFPGITFELAMKFALTNGILPENDLPVQSFLELETWLRQRQNS
jgi:hypothetical protein